MRRMCGSSAQRCAPAGVKWRSRKPGGVSRNDQSPNSAQSMAWNIKRFSNDELRNRFVEMLVPQAEVLGITLPDPELTLDADGKVATMGAIDWSEFEAVLAGNGPCNAQRLQHRRQAHEDGAWVREAARAYAEKQRRAEHEGAAA